MPREKRARRGCYLLSPDGRWLVVAYQYHKGEKKPVPGVFPDEYEYQQLYDTRTGARWVLRLGQPGATGEWPAAASGRSL